MPNPTPEEIAGMLSGAQRAAVPGYEGHYDVDALGRVLSIARTFTRLNRGRTQIVRVPERELRLCLNRNGYPIVRLFKNNKARTFEVHRLVCRAFHGEPPAGHEAAHQNGCRTDCRASNLRWATRSENHKDKRRHGTHLTGADVPNAKLTRDRALSIFQRSKAGENLRAIAREFGISDRTVRNIRDGILWANETLAVRDILKEQSNGV